MRRQDITLRSTKKSSQNGPPKEYKFPLFKDEEIGLSCALIKSSVIEQSMDDDVESDKEILKSAYNSCLKDMHSSYRTFMKSST